MVNGAGKKQFLIHQMNDGWLDCFFALHTVNLWWRGGRKKKEERVVRIVRRFELRGVT